MAPLPVQESILPVIQLSITPVILVSGLGSLTIAMTNRLGRIVDRTRLLATAARTGTAADRPHLEAQIKIMFRRGKIMRWALTLIVSSMFISGSLIALLFANAVLGISMDKAILAVFISAIASMLGGLACFVSDIFVSLRALRVEVLRTLADIDGE